MTRFQDGDHEKKKLGRVGQESTRVGEDTDVTGTLYVVQVKEG